uniref:Uncharacterized protein n=1 Tax=Tanacetum cinerariifolium TaxID=118510 RepID=A0A6L2L8K4_TANCI|nr:hypothetical protein [Tanacetum cinerariifolium]
MVPLNLRADEVVYQEGGDSVERAITIDASLETAHASDNILKTQTTAMPNVDIPQGMDTCGSPRRQKTMGGTSGQTRFERMLKQPYEPPFLEGHTSGSEEGRMELIVELTDIVPPIPYDSPLTGGYIPGSDEDEEESSVHIEDSPKKGRMIKELNKDKDVNLSYFKGMKYEDIRPIFERVWDQVHTFVPKDSEIEKEVMKRYGFHLQQESSKKQKLDQQTEEKEEEVEAQADSDQKVEEMKLYMRILLDEDIEIHDIPLATKPPVIVEYIIVKEGKISTYHITRSSGSTKRYTSMMNFLKNINREDLEALWKLIKDKHRNTRPKEGYERVL